MGYSIARCKTKYGVQVRVVQNIDGATKYVKTVGTSKNEIELERLLSLGQQYINNLENNLWSDPSFELSSKKDLPNESVLPIIKLNNFKKIKTIHSVAYQSLAKIYNELELPKVLPILFKDLVVTRLVHPDSKRATVELMKEYFDLDYTLDSIYALKKTVPLLKDEITKATVNFAINKLNADLTLAFYDVTTLYFESFTEDELKKCGFSKDHKFNQPQVVIGLLVTKTGFPLSYELYPGNTFEGKTFIPIIKDFKTKYQIQHLTIVADSAMMSKTNFDDLVKEKLDFIVGARVSSLKLQTIEEVSSELNKTDGKTFRKITLDKPDDKRFLVLSYSQNRANKDRSDRLKQIAKAESILKEKNTKVSHTKFLKKVGKDKDKYELNSPLIQKAEKLEGIKGYYTNLTLTDSEIIQIYSNLWRIEENFRVSKTDLEIRPIFHWKDQGIKFHILLNFVSLAIARIIEIRNDCSVKSFVKDLMKYQDIYIQQTDSNQIYLIQSEKKE